MPVTPHPPHAGSAAIAIVLHLSSRLPLILSLQLYDLLIAIARRFEYSRHVFILKVK